MNTSNTQRTYIPAAEMEARTDKIGETPNGLTVKLADGSFWYWQPYAQGWQPSRSVKVQPISK